MLDQRLSNFILELYRLAREVPFRRFQNAAIDHLTQLIAFDSAWWGNASRDTMQIHRIHLYNCDASIIRDYPSFMEEDIFRQALVDNPGETINNDTLMPRAEFLKTRLYREYAAQHKIEAVIGTLIIDSTTSLFEFLTTWRHVYRPFTQAECALKQFVMPHLVEAHRLSRRLEVMEHDTQASNWAIADASGFLHEASAGFGKLLTEEWPNWQTSKLPSALDQIVLQAGTFTGSRVVIAVRRHEHLRFVEARPLTAIDRLSARELDVARRYASGKTYTAIAAALGVSPTTVRNQIARCYAKLDVSNKAELVQRLNAHQN